MASLGGLALLASVGLEVGALRNPSDYGFKIAATTASLYSLWYFVQYPPAGSFMSVWPLGMNIYSQVQRCINHSWLRHPDELARKDDPAKGKESPSGRAKLTTTEALDLSLAIRGLGWSVIPLPPIPIFSVVLTSTARRFQVRRLPAHPLASSSRLYFAFSQLSGAILRYLVLDFGISLTNLSLTTLTGTSLPLRLALGALMILYVRWVMDIPYRLVSSVTVLAGIYTPADWPPLFGRWDDAFTVRRFWSHTWHQCMSQIAGPPVKAAVRKLGLNHWGVVVGNFVFAYLDHAYGRVIAGGNHKDDLVMFALQPAAIWVEDMVRDVLVAWGLVDRGRRSRVEIAMGYVWVAVFQCWTFLAFMNGAIRVYGGVPKDTLIEPVYGVSVLAPVLGRYFSS
jgi:hypothetical protein